MSYHNKNAMNQQSFGQECHLNHTNPDHTESFSANFVQRQYFHESNNLEQRTLLNSSSSSCCQPSKHHSSRHGEPLYRSLLKPHHCSQPSFIEYAEGAHHLHDKQCLFETENSAASSCFSQQCVHYNPCRCGSPTLHESNTRMGLLSKGQSYYPNRALPNEITLYNWYLIRSGDLHSSDIAIGGFLSSRRTEAERIETATIVKRLEECKLLTKDGNVINLVGPIDDYTTVANGFTLQTVHLFISGFPHIWNLLVGMGLPAKTAGAITSSRSCDFHGGEITFQGRSQKETEGERGYMEHISAFEELETDLVSYLEGERNLGAKHVTEEPVGVETNIKIPEKSSKEDQPLLHSQVQEGISLPDGECQSEEDQPLLDNQVQEKESDKKAGKEGNRAEECSQHDASHGGNQEKNQSSQAFLEATANAAAEADKISSENLELASSQSFEMSEGDPGMPKSNKTSCSPSSKRRKVVFSTANYVDGGDPSCASRDLEISTKSIKKSCSLFSQDLICSTKGIEKAKVVRDKKATAKKRKGKRRGRVLLLKSKRSIKPMVDLKKRENAVKRQMGSSHEEELDRGFKEMESRNLKNGHVAVTEQDHPTDKIAEQMSVPILVARTREKSTQKIIAKKGFQTKLVAKDPKDSMNETTAKHVEGEDLLPSRDGLKRKKMQRSGGLDLELQLDASKLKEANKFLEKLEIMQGENSSFTPKICIEQTHDGDGPVSTTSARKRMKMLLPPLPSPLMTVSKQLVSKAFGLKTSRSGRLLVPPLAHWRGQSLVRDMDGGIIAIEDGSQGTPQETGCFNFKPPIEAGAKKLQEWLSKTASKCLTKKVNARNKGKKPKAGLK